MITSEKILKGKVFSIYAICKNNKCFIREFIDELNESDKKKIFALLEWTADHGAPKNEQKFKKVDDNLFELKANQVRIFCTFEKGKILLLISGFVKKKNKTPENEKNKAINLLNEYRRQK